MMGGLLGTAHLIGVSVKESEADGVFLAWLRDCEALLDVPFHLAPVAVAEHLPGLKDTCISQHMATTNEVSEEAQPLHKVARSIRHSSPHLTDLREMPMKADKSHAGVIIEYLVEQ
eukprot:scaffold5917_cov18-Prasinocladus_malaysianus.AAC.1